MLASNHSCSTVMPFESNILRKKVVFDKNSCTTSLPRVFITFKTLEHPYIHLNMKCVTSPICHVVHELVLFHYNKWAVSITKIWALNVNDSSCHSNIFVKSVINENHRTSISFYDDSRYVFDSVNYSPIIKFCVGINHILKKIIRCPFLIRAELELKTCLGVVCIL